MVFTHAPLNVISVDAKKRKRRTTFDFKIIQKRIMGADCRQHAAAGGGVFAKQVLDFTPLSRSHPGSRHRLTTFTLNHKRHQFAAIERKAKRR